MSSHGEHAALERAEAVRDAFEGEPAVEGLDPTASLPEPEVPRHRRGLSPLGCASMLVVAGIVAAVVAGVREESSSVEEHQRLDVVFERLAALQEGQGDQPWLRWAAEVCLRLDPSDCGQALDATEAVRDRRCDEARAHFEEVRGTFRYREAVSESLQRAMHWDVEHCRE